LEKTLTGVVQGPRHIIMVKTLWVQFDWLKFRQCRFGTGECRC
jgi:hypothetical protein